MMVMLVFINWARDALHIGSSSYTCMHYEDHTEAAVCKVRSDLLVFTVAGE
jgi:hypothetical protein